MLYYLGKGSKFKKEECKEYKTIEGALKAAAKDESFVVWDETGKVIGSTGAISAKEAEALTGNAAGQQDAENIQPGKTRVTVICNGALNLRRSAAWGNGNICGRATRGQKYNVKAVHMVAGKKMIETVDGLFLSGQPEHVQLEKL